MQYAFTVGVISPAQGGYGELHRQRRILHVHYLKINTAHKLCGKIRQTLPSEIPHPSKGVDEQ
jgi:hypothetical protein